MQTDAATGTITIADARSEGLTLEDLRGPVTTWAAERQNRRLLADIRAQAGSVVYLRVVNRVFTTRHVTIALSNDRAFGGAAEAGQSIEVALLADAIQDEARHYVETLDQLNRPLEPSFAGGRVKILQASSRTVTLAEMFERPLVFGYVAFDFPVFEDGSLGAPAVTRSLLEGIKPPDPVRLGELSPLQEDYGLLRCAIAALDSMQQISIYDRAKTAIGGEFAEAYDAAIATGAPADEAFTRARTSYTFVRQDESRRRQERVYNALRSAWREESP